MNILWKLAHGSINRGLILHKIGRLLEIMNFILCSNAVSAGASIGDRTEFHHHAIGCVVHEKAIIGTDCHIFQNVTIGSRWPNGVCEGEAPQIGNHVFIGAGAVLLGNIKIGDNSIIGANAVVTMDVPECSIAVGIPAVIREKKSRQYGKTTLT